MSWQASEGGAAGARAAADGDAGPARGAGRGRGRGEDRSPPGPGTAAPPELPVAPEGPPSLSIGEVCGRTGLSPRTVRYYEELGLLPGVRRRAGGRRVYGRDELERLRFVLRLKSLGLSLEEIRELNAVHALEGSTRAMLRRLDELLGRRLAETEARLAELDRLRRQIQRYRHHVRDRIGRSPDRAAGRASR